MAPIFLSLTEVLEVHRYQVEQFGGSDGCRDLTLVESAIAQPQARFGEHYLHGDLFEMAAAYLFHLCANHPFVDGNKRTATHVAILFLAVNGIRLRLPVDEAEALVLRVANGQARKPEVAAFLKACAT